MNPAFNVNSISVKRILREIKEINENKSSLFTAAPLEVYIVCLEAHLFANFARTIFLSGILQFEDQETQNLKEVYTMAE